MTSILFLAPRDLGEAVLATGALAYAAHEGDEVAVVATREALPLFRATPGLVQEIKLDVDAGGMEMAALAFAALNNRFDLAIDGRGRMLAWMAARKRVTLAGGNVIQHRCEAWGAALGAGRTLTPVLRIDEAARVAAASVIADAQSLLILAPGGVSARKKWPAERFAAVARRLHGGPLANAPVILLGAAARDAEGTHAIATSLDADGVAALDLGEGLDLLAAAALMERATLCIGNDNALTHIAAAAGAPTLTIFGPTDERVRAPYGPRARTIRGRSFAEVSLLDGGGAMEDVSIDAVEAAALELLHAGGLR